MNSADSQSSMAPERPASPTPLWRNAKLLAGTGALAVALTIGAVSYAATRQDPTAAVLRIVDGNSLEVDVAGEIILASQVAELTADPMTPSETTFPMLAFAGEASRGAREGAGDHLRELGVDQLEDAVGRRRHLHRLPRLRSGRHLDRHQGPRHTKISCS